MIHLVGFLIHDRVAADTMSVVIVWVSIIISQHHEMWIHYINTLTWTLFEDLIKTRSAMFSNVFCLQRAIISLCKQLI